MVSDPVSDRESPALARAAHRDGRQEDQADRPRRQLTQGRIDARRGISLPTVHLPPANGSAGPQPNRRSRYQGLADLPGIRLSESIEESKWIVFY